MITSTITVDDEKGVIPKLFAAEEQALLNERASYKTHHDKGKTHIVTEAQDATALRAVLNSVCKVLIVHEKMSELKTT